jgi:hypothetical protein
MTGFPSGHFCIVDVLNGNLEQTRFPIAAYSQNPQNNTALQIYFTTYKLVNSILANYLLILTQISKLASPTD